MDKEISEEEWIKLNHGHQIDDRNVVAVSWRFAATPACYAHIDKTGYFDCPATQCFADFQSFFFWVEAVPHETLDRPTSAKLSQAARRHSRLRLGRIFRMLRFHPELRLLVKSCSAVYIGSRWFMKPCFNSSMKLSFAETWRDLHFFLWKQMLEKSSVH